MSELAVRPLDAPDGRMVATIIYDDEPLTVERVDPSGAADDYREAIEAALGEIAIPIVVKFCWDADPVGYLDLDVLCIRQGKWLCFWHGSRLWEIRNQSDREFRFNALWAEVPEEYRSLSWEPWARCPVFGPILVPPGKVTKITWENAPIFKLRVF